MDRFKAIALKNSLVDYKILRLTEFISKLYCLIIERFAKQTYTFQLVKFIYYLSCTVCEVHFYSFFTQASMLKYDLWW